MPVQRMRSAALVGLGFTGLGMAIGLLAFSAATLACGGGGSGSYRKPPRPGHQHAAAVSKPQGERTAAAVNASGGN